TRPNDRFVLSRPRFDSQYRCNSWRLSVETRTGIEFSRSSHPRNSWNDCLCENRSAESRISPEQFEKGVGQAAKSPALARYLLQGPTRTPSKCETATLMRPFPKSYDVQSEGICVDESQFTR